ncbi:MAG: glutamate dehydrogenase, partial [bacterium]
YATGLGGFYILSYLFSERKDILTKYGVNKNFEDVTVSLQGFGNVGFYLAQFLYQNGVKIIAISDVTGTIYNPKGLDITKLSEYVTQTGGVYGFPNAESSKSTDEALFVETDVLIPAATENVINEDNYHKVKAFIVAEAANGPITYKAYMKLIEQNKLIIPDILYNSGGVTVSYFEYLKNLSHVRFGRLEKRLREENNLNLIREIEKVTGKSIDYKKIINGFSEEDIVKSGLYESMVNAFNSVYSKAELIKADLKTAAFALALEKIAVSYKQLGIFP